MGKTSLSEYKIKSKHVQGFESTKFVDPLLSQVLGVMYIQENIGLGG